MVVYKILKINEKTHKILKEKSRKYRVPIAQQVELAVNHLDLLKLLGELK